MRSTASEAFANAVLQLQTVLLSPLLVLPVLLDAAGFVVENQNLFLTDATILPSLDSASAARNPSTRSNSPDPRFDGSVCSVGTRGVTDASFVGVGGWLNEAGIFAATKPHPFSISLESLLDAQKLHSD